MTTLVGVAGATIILIFFLLDQSHKMNSDNPWYDIGNFVGSLLLVIYAYLLSSLPFLVLNAVWAAFSLKDIISDLGRKR